MPRRRWTADPERPSAQRAEHARALETLALAFRRRNLSAGHTRNVLSAVARFLVGVRRKRLTSVSRLDVERYLAARAREGASPDAVRREWCALHVFFATLLDHELLAASPTAGMEVARPERPPPLLLSEAAVKKLLHAASDPARHRPGPFGRALALRDRALLELYYATGVRDSEARGARVVDLDQEGATLLVRSAKRGVWRRVPLPPRAFQAIVRYLREARPVLLRGRTDPGHLLVTKRGTPLAQPTAFRVVVGVARGVGLRAHPHALRRAIATHLIRAQVPVPAVQALLGHRQLSTTATYLTVDRADLHRTVALLERTKDR